MARPPSRARGRHVRRPGAGRVVGSGFDVDGEETDALAQRQRAREALTSDLPVLVDAGALELVDLLTGRDAPTLLTPHAGELSRLLTTLRGEDVDRRAVEAAPLAHARDAARRTGATVLLKGSTTLVVDPDDTVPVRAQRDAPPGSRPPGPATSSGACAGRCSPPVSPPRRRVARRARPRRRRRPGLRRRTVAHPRRRGRGRPGGAVAAHPLSPAPPVRHPTRPAPPGSRVVSRTGPATCENRWS